MFLALNAGKTSLLKRAQWGQLAEAYSITVTFAVGLPRLMSSAVTVSVLWNSLSQAARLRAASMTARSIRGERRMGFCQSSSTVGASKRQVKRDSGPKAQRDEAK